MMPRLFLWPFNRVKAVDYLKHATLILGFTCQLTKDA